MYINIRNADGISQLLARCRPIASQTLASALFDTHTMCIDTRSAPSVYSRRLRVFLSPRHDPIASTPFTRSTHMHCCPQRLVLPCSDRSPTYIAKGRIRRKNRRGERRESRASFDRYEQREGTEFSIGGGAAGGWGRATGQFRKTKEKKLSTERWNLERSGL